MAELYNRHAAFCRSRALHVLRDPALAEDAAQEAMLDLWRGADRFDPARSPLRAWLSVLVHRRSVDIARHEASLRARDERYEIDDPLTRTAEELVILRWERKEVGCALRLLPALQRELLEHAYYGACRRPSSPRASAYRSAR